MATSGTPGPSARAATGSLPDRRVPDPAWLRAQYVERGRSSEQIAAECGRSSQYVRDRLREHGIALRRPGIVKPQRLDEHILGELVDAGRPVAQIATATGYSRSGVYTLLRRWRIPLPAQHPPAGRDHAVLAELTRLYRDERRSLAEVGAAFGRGPAWAKARLAEAGVSLRPGGPPRRVDRAAIARLLRQHLPITQVAERVGASEWAVREVARAENIAPPPRRPPPARLPALDTDLLRHLYLDQRHTLAEIATQFGCSPDRVRQAMIAAGIARRAPGHRDDVRPAPIGPGLLRELYLDRELSATKIAERLGCTRTRVLAALDRHQIPRRREPRSAAPLPVDAATLTRLYVDQRLDDAALARRYGVPPGRVRSRRRELRVFRPPAAPPHTTAPAAPTRTELDRAYHGEQLTVAAIARRYHTSTRTVHQWLTVAGIPVRERTARRHRKRLDPDLLRELYEDQQQTAAEIAARYGTTPNLVLRALHDYGIPVRVGGPRRSVDDHYRLLAALYADPAVTGLLRRWRIPRQVEPGPIADRFPAPIPLNPALLREAYTGIGLSARHIELLIGQPAGQILDALHAAGIRVRTGQTPSPWLARHRATGAPPR